MPVDFNRYALLIACSDYSATDDFSDLPKTLADLCAMRGVLIDPDICGFPESQVQTLENASGDDVRAEVYRFFHESRFDDFRLLYFAGHGMLEDNQFFLALKGTSKDVPNTGLVARDLRDYLKDTPARRKLVILDCCHAAGLVDGRACVDEGLSYSRGLGLDVANDVEQPGEGIWVLAGSGKTQKALEQKPHEQNGNGHYTCYLVDGLKRFAQGAFEGKPTFSAYDLHCYAAKRVKQETVRKQEPHYFALKERSSLILAKRPKPPLPDWLLELQRSRNVEKRSAAIDQLVKIVRDDLPYADEAKKVLLEWSKDRQESVDIHDVLLNTCRELGLANKSTNEKETKDSLTCLLKQQRSRAVEARSATIDRLAKTVSNGLSYCDKAKKVLFKWGQDRKRSVNINGVLLNFYRKLSLANNRANKQEVKVSSFRFSRLINISIISLIVVISAKTVTDIVDLEVKELSLARNKSICNNLYNDALQQHSLLMMKEFSKKCQMHDAFINVSELIKTWSSTKKNPATRSDHSIFNDCTTCPEMVVIPSGSFKFSGKGRASDSPTDKTHVNRFAMGSTEITFNDWNACVQGGGCKTTPNPDGNGWGSGLQPVINVDYFDILEYVRWLNGQVDGMPYRLPSEKEWEYSARGNTSDQVDNTQESYDARLRKSDHQDRAVPVMSLSKANSFNLYDLHGNVWEWTRDCWTSNHTELPRIDIPHISPSPSTDCIASVMKGGSWKSDSWMLKATSRERISRAKRGGRPSVGFRVMREL